MVIKIYFATIFRIGQLKVLAHRAFHTQRFQKYLTSDMRTMWLRATGPAASTAAVFREIGWAQTGPHQISDNTGQH